MVSRLCRSFQTLQNLLGRSEFFPTDKIRKAAMETGGDRRMPDPPEIGRAVVFQISEPLRVKRRFVPRQKFLYSGGAGLFQPNVNKSLFGGSRRRQMSLSPARYFLGSVSCRLFARANQSLTIRLQHADRFQVQFQSIPRTSWSKPAPVVARPDCEIWPDTGRPHAQQADRGL